MRRFDAPAELRRFLALLGTTSLAFAQPVLSAFGNSPETFIFRQASGVAIVQFGLVIVLVPPLVLWAAGCLCGAVRPSIRSLVHGLTVGALVALAAVQVVASAPLAAKVLLGVVVGGAVAVLVTRSAAVRLWTQVLAVLPAYSLAVFLVASPASDLIGSDGFDPVAEGRSDTPIVLVVLDELSTASLITAEGEIDATRFPNLAGFAEGATWYRNATSVAGFTGQAVPAIVTGQMPRRAAPVSANYPDNLFRLASGTHDLVVSETITKLCPASVCGDGPTAPSAGGGAVRRADADLGGLIGDARSVWVDRLTDDDRISLRTEQFQERVGEAPDPGADEAEPVAQPERLTAFLSALQPADRPIAAVLHLVAPHSPWRFLPDGRRYADPATESGLAGVYPDEWVASVGRQTHLLQAAYADRLIGQVLRRLEEVGTYDDAVVAIVADHGVSFAPNQMRRGFTATTSSELMWVPMLVKAPNQDQGVLDESNIEITDLLPTIADLAGIDVPWAVDGASAGSEAIARRGDRKTFMRFTNSIIQPEPDRRLTVDGRRGYRQMLAGSFPAVTSSEDPSRGLYELSGRDDLVGTPFRTEGQVDGSAQVDELDRLTSEDLPVVTVSGAVRGVGEDAHVAVAIDDTIVATSPVVRRRDGRLGFEVLLPVPDGAGLPGLRLAVAGADGGALRSLPLA